GSVPTSQFAVRHDQMEQLQIDDLNARFAPQHESRADTRAHIRQERPAYNPSSVALNATPPSHPTSSVPRGKPIEVSQMFQMYALTNSLPSTPSHQQMMPPQLMQPPNHHGVAMHMNLPLSSDNIPPMGSMPAFHSNSVPANLYNHTLPGPPPPGLRPGLHTPSASNRPLIIAGLGHQQPQVHHSGRQIPQPVSTRSKSSSSDNRRSKDESGQSSNRPKAPVPAPAAPPS
ncbi:hypothetical protein BVRB_029710, partial [Beta vulgaris subsp. vulgaris]